jgi:hypothetical protein
MSALSAMTSCLVTKNSNPRPLSSLPDEIIGNYFPGDTLVILVSQPASLTISPKNMVGCYILINETILLQFPYHAFCIYRQLSGLEYFCLTFRTTASTFSFKDYVLNTTSHPSMKLSSLVLRYYQQLKTTLRTVGYVLNLMDIFTQCYKVICDSKEFSTIGK